MDRMILHSDINACYASIELLRHPELRGRPVAVGGEQELRHGIILAKDQMARAAGVCTGMTLWGGAAAVPGADDPAAGLRALLRLFAPRARDLCRLHRPVRAVRHG